MQLFKTSTKASITLRKPPDPFTPVYNEIGQRNPLRWRILFRNDDGSFVDQAYEMKCKDFFNDVVVFFKTKHKFKMYGFENSMKDNDGGLYMLLSNIQDMDKFTANIAVLNEQIEKDLGCYLTYQEGQGKDSLIMFFPKPCWSSTYVISLVSFLVRVCNYSHQFKKWDDFWMAASPVRIIESALSAEAQEYASKLGFKVPEKYSKYWWYAGPEYNSEKNSMPEGVVIHNNGASNWAHYMRGAYDLVV